jgi:hypothetical protein
LAECIAGEANAHVFQIARLSDRFRQGDVAKDAGDPARRHVPAHRKPAIRFALEPIGDKMFRIRMLGRRYLLKNLTQLKLCIQNGFHILPSLHLIAPFTRRDFRPAAIRRR